MTLVKYDPFRIRGLQRELDNLMEEFFGRSPFVGTDSRFVPEMDVIEDDKSVIVRMEIPGVDRDKIKVTMENGVLTISGTKEEVREAKDVQYHICERRFGTFTRKVALADFLNPEKTEASYKDGVLEIRVEKREEAKPRSIDVKVK
ncbi:MAG: Hsp20/alpha crystallin family protein [Planctomycetota bacterium]|nr:Hsp20/alpha crystallin family protein [Planctomycetota bacterium]